MREGAGGQGKFKMMERKKALDRHQMSVHLGETRQKADGKREVPHKNHVTHPSSNPLN